MVSPPPPTAAGPFAGTVATCWHHTTRDSATRRDHQQARRQEQPPGPGKTARSRRWLDAGLGTDGLAQGSCRVAARGLVAGMNTT